MKIEYDDGSCHHHHHHQNGTNVANVDEWMKSKLWTTTKNSKLKNKIIMGMQKYS